MEMVAITPSLQPFFGRYFCVDPKSTCCLLCPGMGVFVTIFCLTPWPLPAFVKATLTLASQSLRITPWDGH